MSTIDMSKEATARSAMKLALEALAVKFSEGWHEGIKIDASDIMLLNDAAQALASEALEQPAPVQQERCRLCDCTGDIHSPDGEWRGECPYCTASVQQEPVARQYQNRDGVWKDFISEKHYKDTLEDGSWPIRNLYTSPPAQQEPVAWREFDGEGDYFYRDYYMNEQYAQEWDQRNPNHKGWVEPLYTSPPAQRQARSADTCV